jgi:hypothetical protein
MRHSTRPICLPYYPSPIFFTAEHVTQQLQLEEMTLSRYFSGRIHGNNRMPVDQMSQIISCPREPFVIARILFQKAQSELRAAKMDPEAVINGAARSRVPTTAELMIPHVAALLDGHRGSDYVLDVIGPQGRSNALQFPSLISDWRAALHDCQVEAAAVVASSGFSMSDELEHREAEEENRTRILMSALATTTYAAIRVSRSPVTLSVTSNMKAAWAGKVSSRPSEGVGVVSSVLTALGSLVTQLMHSGWATVVGLATAALQSDQAFVKAVSKLVTFDIAVSQQLYAIRIQYI